MTEPATTEPRSEPTIRAMAPGDGGAVWRLVEESGVLDVNSSYAYLLWCRQFGSTSVVAEVDGEIVGFVTGFRPPEHPEVIFVWQVGVDASMRGRGLAKRLLLELVALPGCAGVTHMHTTVTPSNAPSRALFRSFGRAVDAEVEVGPYLTEEMFPDPGHEAEELFRIGPFAPRS
jgi:L-2,4-diaminobutyric acid acetyltransferase